jgi:hypothetical protein
MALQRLRRILRSNLVVRIESSTKLLSQVQAKIAARIAECQQKNRPIPDFKPSSLLPAFDGLNWSIRPADLLHKLGRMTTPRNLGNMSRLSASWATRRYFWAIAEELSWNNFFRLSNDAIGLDFHQKTLLSDEFGVAMAGLFMEQRLGAPSSLDISLALRDEQLKNEIQQTGDTQPDYLMWSQQPNPPYFVIECKGTQSGRNQSLNQLRRGLEQLPSIVFTNNDRQSTSIVFATCMSSRSTTLFLIDPPDDSDSKREELIGEQVSHRTGTRVWTIPDPERLERRIDIGSTSQILQWAGQSGTAKKYEEQLLEAREKVFLPDKPLARRKTAEGDFLGQEVLLFPDLDLHLKAFLGVEEELLAAAKEGNSKRREISMAISHRFDEAVPEKRAPNLSVSADGTCMIIEGIDL